MGHHIGLHFDAAFHVVSDAAQLSSLVRDEADLLHNTFGTRPVAFSFHNPVETHLRFDHEIYGGLVNCYSRRFKTEVPYCSDSNGYWRFRRLRDVLASGSDVCLQVLTHPGWWMDVPMPPRHRVFRSAFGRAHAAISLYDSAIAAHGRENFAGRADALKILRGVPAGRYALLDFLWMTGEMATLYLELWRLHESQVSGLCRAALQKQWHVSAQELDNFFQNPNLNIDATRMFTELFGCSFHEVARVGVDSYLECARLCKTLLRGRGAATTQQLEDGCVALCRIIAEIGRAHV